MFNFLKGLVSKANAKITVEQLSKQAALLATLKRAASAVDNDEAAAHYNNMWADVIAKKWAIEESWDYALEEPTWFDRMLSWFYQDLN